MHFKFFIGGYFGESIEIHLQEDKLLFSVYNGFIEKMLPIQPDDTISIKDDDDWHNLVAFIEALKWKQKYIDNDILDGTQWELTFKSDSKKLNCYGSNAYPENFDRFIKLLKKVTKKHKIPFKGW